MKGAGGQEIPMEGGRDKGHYLPPMALHPYISEYSHISGTRSQISTLQA